MNLCLNTKSHFYFQLTKILSVYNGSHLVPTAINSQLRTAKGFSDSKIKTKKMVGIERFQFK